MPQNPQSDNSLIRAIIEVIAFFDLFEYPLTAYEIGANLQPPRKLVEVMRSLDQEINGHPTSTASAVIGQQNGFYFLRGREATVTTRQQRHNYSCRKIAIARRFSRAFSWCPFVRVIAVANSIGSHNLRDGSDIDFFIITAARRLWLSRLYCAGLAKLLNSRPTTQTKQDKICLSFYISTEHLNLQDLQLPGRDPYFDYWRRGLVVLYNQDKTYEQFLAANRLRDFAAAAASPVRAPKSSRWEGLAKHWQLKIMPPVLRAAMNNSDGVVVNDAVLKLYQRDRRREFLEKYGNRLQEIFKDNS
jgi:hypothetical protein